MQPDKLWVAETTQELKRVRKSRELVSRADTHHMREMLEVQARSVFGRDIWRLDLAELEELEATLSVMLEFLENQRVLARGLH